VIREGVLLEELILDDRGGLNKVEKEKLVDMHYVVLIDISYL